MKLFIVLAIIVAVKAKLSDENRHELLDYHIICLTESGVDEEITLAALSGDFSDDPKFKAHLVCFHKHLGIMDESGQLNTDAMKAKLLDFGSDQAVIDDVIARCAVERGSPEETAFEFAKCFHGFREDLF